MKKISWELSILHFLNDGVRSTFVAILPFITKDLALSLSTVGFLGAAQPFFASILAIPAGFIASRFGGFHFLISLLLIYSLGALGNALSPNLSGVILAFSLGALGFGMFHTVGFSLIAKISDKTNIGRNMGNFTAIGDIGRAVIPPAAIFLVSIIGWRGSITSIATLGFIAYAIFLTLGPKRDQHQFKVESKDKEGHKDFFKHLLILLKTKKLILTLLAAVGDAVASNPVFLFLPFLILAKGISVTQYGIITGIFFAGSLFGKFVLGRGVDKLGNLKVFIGSEVFMATSLVLLTISSNFSIVLVIAFLLGIFTKGTIAVVPTMLAQASQKIHYNKTYSLSETFVGISAAIAEVLMGVVASTKGVIFVFYLCAFLGIIATIPALLLSRNRE